MPVLSPDTLCRFVRPRDWSERENRPRPGAFKQAGLSVWHQDKLRERGVALSDLLIEHLAGHGQARHTAGDYVLIAGEAAEQEATPLQVRVEWRPEDEYVAEPWRRWNYAHAQVETIVGPAQFTPLYRKLLALGARAVIPPD